MKDSAIIAGIFTIIGVALGAFITYFFSIKISKRQEFNKAAAKFRETFFNEIITCELDVSLDETSTKISRSISNAIISHKKAMLRFRPFVGKCSIIGFDKAWHNYYSQENRSCMHAKPLPGKPDTFVATNEQELRHIILSQINELFKYAPINK